MRALDFYKTVTMDSSNLLERLLALLAEHEIRYCVIGGQAANAYVEPVVTLDLDIVIAVEQLERAREILEREFTVREFPHSLNISAAGSDLRVQVQTDPVYAGFLAGAQPRDVLGLVLPVAAIEDLLQGKVWAAQDATRRASKRQKDLADISRLLEAHPDLRPRVPRDILDRLI